MITREDRAFLLAHLDEAERILKYVEDNAQSLYEAYPPSPLNRPPRPGRLDRYNLAPPMIAVAFAVFMTL